MVKRTTKSSKATKTKEPPKEEKRERIKISAKAKAWARVKSRVQAHDAQRAQGASINPFQLQPVPPGVLPPDTKPTMAMDDAINAQNSWAGANKTAFFGGLAYISAYQEGLAFPGYPYLTELAQRPEYRRFAETLAMEMTRKWIKVSAVDDDDDTKQGIINGINDELDRLQVRDMFRQCIEMDSFFGRSHLYIDTGQTNDREELKKSIGNGRDRLSQLKITKGSLKRLKSVEPVWTYPTNYDSIDPLTDQWYEPDTWFVMGKEVHKTRLLKFVGREVPDLLKPAYSFGGLSMSQMAMPYVNNWLRTRQSVADIIHAFSVFVLATDMSQTMQEGDDLFERVDFFNFVRDNKGTMLIDKDSELFQNVQASLASLDALQAQTQEHMACLPGETLIETDRGSVPIKEVTIEDKVLTRVGFRSIKWVGVTGDTDTLIQIKVGSSVLRATEYHPIWSESINEFVNAENVSRSHSLLVLHPKKESTDHLLHGGVGGGVKLKQGIIGIKKQADSCIAYFGKHIKDQSQKVMKSITRMMMDQTILGTTLLALPALSTFGLMEEREDFSKKYIVRYANNVVENSKQHGNAHNIVREHVKLEHFNSGMVGSHGNFTTKNVSFAGSLSQQNEKTLRSGVPIAACSVPVGNVTTIKVPRQKVYNIEVDDGPPEFFANRILVHNSVSGIPIVKLLGIQPAGLNASSEGELRSFFDWILAFQEKMLRPHLTTIIDMCMLNLYGKVDDSITFNFEPLWSLDEKGMAEVRSIEAETGVKLIESGVISQEEERKRVAADPESEYSSIEVEDVPDLLDEEEQGLEPKGGAARIAEGAGEAGGQIDVPNKGVGGKAGIPDPKGHETGAGMPDGEDKEAGQMGLEPYFQKRLRAEYLKGKNPLLHRYLNGKNGGIEGALMDGVQLNPDFLKEIIATHEDEDVDQSSLDINAGEGTGGREERDTSIGSEHLNPGFLRERTEEENAANPDRFEDDDQRGTPHNRELAMRALDLLRRKRDAKEVKGRNVRTARGGQVHLQTGGLGNRTAGGLRREAERARRNRLGNEDDEVGRWDNWTEGESELGQDSFDFKEHEHKRDKDGKFTSGGGGGGGAKQNPTPKPSFYGGKPKLNKSDLTKVGGQLGSNEGGKYEDAQGNKFYIKKGKSKEHVSNEYLAADLFKMSGFRTQKYRDVEGGDDIATEWENYDKNNAKDFTAEEKKEAQKLFATHAWLANWDAAGLDYDNQAMKNGKAVALDLGGALEYRAQGAPKGDKFGNKTGEWDSMRDSKVNPQNAQLFKGMSKDDLLKSALAVALIPDDDIKKAVKKRGKSSELADKLIDRKRDLEHKANGDPQDASNPVTFFNDQELPVKELNGIAFKEWKPPSDWSSLEDVELDGDDEIDTTPTGGGKRKRAATGILMRESDGRLWLMRPKNRFGDYDQTVPKGGVEDGLSYQQNAIKEVWEETGLKAKITGIAGDIEGDTSVTRYYIGERETGDPALGSWESSATVLVPPEKASQYLNRSRDRKVIDMAGDEFVESQHPRDANGQFSKYQHTIGLSGQGESGKAVKQLFEDLGFEKGKSSSGKHKYTSKNLDVVVVEPPKGAKPNPKAKEGATPWSSVWTLYPKEGDIIKGKGNKDLQAHLEKLKEAGVNVNAKKDEKKVEQKLGELDKLKKAVGKPTDYADFDTHLKAMETAGKLYEQGYTFAEIKSVMDKQKQEDFDKMAAANEGYDPDPINESNDDTDFGKIHGIEGTAQYIENPGGGYTVGLLDDDEELKGQSYDVDTLENAKDIGNALAKGFLKPNQKIEKKPDGTYGAPNAGKVEIKGVGTEKSNSPANFGSALETVQEYENKADGISSKVLKKDGKFVGVLIDTDDDKVVGSKAFDTEDEAKAYAKDFVGEEATEKRRTAQPEPPKGQKQAKQEEPPKGQKGPSAEEVLKQKPDFHKTLTEHGYSNPQIQGEGKSKGIVLEKNGAKVKLANGPNGEIQWLSKPNPPHLQKQGTGFEGLAKILSGTVDKNLMQNVPNASFEHWPAEAPAAPTPAAAPKPVSAKPEPVASPKVQQKWEKAWQDAVKAGKFDGKLDALRKDQPAISAKEKSAIHSYTGGQYTEINNNLRHHNGKIVPGTTAGYAQDYLKKCSIPEDTTVFRKVKGDYANIIQGAVVKGSIFKDKGFVSTSVNPKTWGGSMLMVISVKKGAKGSPVKHMSSNPSEDEVVFKAGSQMRVDHMEKHPEWSHGVLHVTMMNEDEEGESFDKKPIGV